MTLEEYVNRNLKNAVLRGYSKDSELTVRLREIRGRTFVVSFVSFISVPDLMRIDLPIEGFVLTVIGRLTSSGDGYYTYTVFDKAGILQRRTKPRYVAFERCEVEGLRSVILDVSENGCQLLSEYRPRLREELRIALAAAPNEPVKGVVMWFVEEEECYRFGVYIPEPNQLWQQVHRSYQTLGEKL